MNKKVCGDCKWFEICYDIDPIIESYFEGNNLNNKACEEYEYVPLEEL